MRRGQYRVTKVTTKMIFAVDFGTRHLDHFFPPSAQGGGGRTVVHDSSTWSSGDTVPGGSIASMDDLRATIQCVREVATEWYPEEVVNDFAAVYADASSRVLNNAPLGLVHAMVNLYTHVLSRLFMSINQGAPAASLVEQARAIMATDSPDYARLVRQVIDHGLFSTWAQAQDTRAHRSDSPRSHVHTARSRNSSQRNPRQPRQQKSPVPDTVTRQIPTRDGKSVCLKFQTLRSCSYRGYKFFHGLERLPSDVAQYTTDKYGPLAAGHPNLANGRYRGEFQAISKVYNMTPAFTPHSPLSHTDQPTQDVGQSVLNTEFSDPSLSCTSPPPTELEPLTLAFDGGARHSPPFSAYACCAWSLPGQLVWWSATSLSPGGSNNEMEAKALLTGLQWLWEYHRSRPVQIVGDSAIIIAMASGSARVQATNLVPLIREIRHYINPLHRVHIVAGVRAFNVAADALCNWVMDLGAPGRHLDATDTECPLLDYQSHDPFAWGCPPVLPVAYADYALAQWQVRWSLVLLDFARVAHLVQHRFLRRHSDVLPLPVSPDASRSTVDTPARAERSPFDTSVHRERVINGIARCVPLGVFRSFQTLVATNHLPFPINRVFRKPIEGRLSLPFEDIRFLTEVVRLPQLGIEGTLRIFRGQTSRDGRPNKALRSRLYRRHLASYPDLELLCHMADHGVVPHWYHPEARLGVRPLPNNYPSAMSGAAIVTHRLLKDYYAGRCIFATVVALTTEPGFHSSAFALVPKKDVPLSEAGRIIHDLSAPCGSSVNDATDSTLTPDAGWDPFSCIELRILELRIRYPGCRVYALVADIAEAFHHVPVHARHSSAFGGTFPRSQIGIVSGMAVFGWTASPGFFAVMGKATRHYQRSGVSHVNGYPEPFWIFEWVDDIVLIEVDLDDRLLRAERRLRDAVKLVFGSDGWHEGKFTTWCEQVHAVGIDWNIPKCTVTIPKGRSTKQNT